MSLEQAMEANTAAVVALHTDIKNMLAQMKRLDNVLPAVAAETAAPASATTDKKGPGRPKKTEEAAAAPKVTFDEVKTALMKVKEEKGKDAAQAIIKDVGKAEKMAEIKEPNYAAVIAACEAALAGDDGNDDDI